MPSRPDAILASTLPFPHHTPNCSHEAFTMRLPILFPTLVALLPLVSAQSPHIPLTTQCYPSLNVLCIKSYLSVLPPLLPHTPRQRDPVTLPEVQLPSAYSRTTAALATAPFLLFDAARGTEVLGAAPAYDFMFRRQRRRAQGAGLCGGGAATVREPAGTTGGVPTAAGCGSQLGDFCWVLVYWGGYFRVSSFWEC